MEQINKYKRETATDVNYENTVLFFLSIVRYVFLRKNVGPWNFVEEGGRTIAGATDQIQRAHVSQKFRAVTRCTRTRDNSDDDNNGNIVRDDDGKNGFRARGVVMSDNDRSVGRSVGNPHTTVRIF